VAGALLRFATLDARSLWLDEALTADMLDGDLGALLSGLTERSRSSSPPLYYLLAWPWAKLFGTGEIALRSLPALLGTVTIPVAYAVGRELASRRVGLIAAALATFSPVLVWQSQDARQYALLVLLGGLSFLFFIRSLRTGRGRVLAAWAAASALAVATHYLAIFLVAAEAAWLLWTRRTRPVAVAVGCVAAAVVALAPLVAVQRNLGQGGFVADLDLGSRIVQVPAQFLVGYQPPLQIAASVVAAVLALVAVGLLFRRGDESERRAAAIAAAIGAAALTGPALLAFVGVDYVLTRYLTGAWVVAAAVAAIGFGARAAGRAGPLAAIALCAVFVAVDLGSAWEPKFDRDDWRGAAAALGPSDAHRAVVLSPGVGMPAFRYYRPRAGEAPAGRQALREIALVGLAPPFREIGRKPRPPRPVSVPAPAPGFRLAGRQEAEHFTIVRFRASSPRSVYLRDLADAPLGGSATVLLDRP
jgi:hypothetical protein